jgi:hypothetical protein
MQIAERTGLLAMFGFGGFGYWRRWFTPKVA